jgi:hypothetical protein
VVGSPLALPEFVAEASFTLRSLTPQADDKARMTFDCQAGWLSARTVNGVALEPSWNGVRRGWIDLLPKANWVIAGYDVEYQGAPGDPNGSYFISGQHEYEMRDAPVIRRVLYQARKRQELGSPLISSHEATYQLQPGAPSQSEFTLSHFGFEEPSWVEASFRPSTAIIGSILLAFGICGAALLLWRRRRLTRAA